MAMIKYLLVGFGRDGEIYEDTELKQRLNFSRRRLVVTTLHLQLGPTVLTMCI